MQRAGLWPIHVFCNILDRISSFVYVHQKFCNKDFFLDLFSLVLIEFLVFTSCQSCIKAVLVHEMHWKRVGNARKTKEWATTHFRVSVTTENSDSMLRQWVECRDRSWSGWVFFDRDKGFLGRNKASWLYVAT